MNEPTSSTRGRLDARLWNLFLPMAVAACGPGGLSSDGSDDTSSATDADTGESGETGDGPCVDQSDCPPEQLCVDGECVNYYSTDGNYYDGNWYFYCYDITDCGGGEVCEGYDCMPTDDPPPCDFVPELEVLSIPEPGDPVLAIAFTNNDEDAPEELAVLGPFELAVWSDDGTQEVVSLPEPIDVEAIIRSGQLDGAAGDDLVVLRRTDGPVDLYLALPGGGLAPGGGMPDTYPFADAALADLDGDGNLDLIGHQSLGSIDYPVSVFPGDGLGNLGVGDVVELPGSMYQRIAIGWLDADGLWDLVTQSENEVRLWDAEQGVLEESLSTNWMTAAAADLVVSDVDGSGGLDLVRLSPSGFSVITEWYDVDGTVKPGETFWTVPGYYERMAAGDVDGDGWDDLVLGGSDELRVRLGAQNCVLELGAYASQELVTGDWDGDGRDEIALLADGFVTILRLP